jgi:hypothetical protein
MNARTLHRLAFRLREARIVLAGLELAPMWLVLALALALAKPAAADTLTYAPPPCVSSGAQTEADLLPCFAPVVIAHGTESAHNRIGAPELARNWLGRLNARVDRVGLSSTPRSCGTRSQIARFCTSYTGCSSQASPCGLRGTSSKHTAIPDFC